MEVWKTINTFACWVTNLADVILKYFFLLFPRKQDLSLNADCLQIYNVWQIIQSINGLQFCKSPLLKVSLF